ncbi:hypothetical protein ACVWW5_001708 [Bradyrhizobium sp. LM3.4]
MKMQSPTRPVADDHHHGEHGVARQFGGRLVAQHDRGDQRHLDDGHRESQHQRAIGFADPFGDHFGMMNRGKDGAEQDDEEHDGEEEPAKRQREHIARRADGCKQQHSQGRKDPGRPGHRTMRAHLSAPTASRTIRKNVSRLSERIMLKRKAQGATIFIAPWASSGKSVGRFKASAGSARAAAASAAGTAGSAPRWHARNNRRSSASRCRSRWRCCSP